MSSNKKATGKKDDTQPALVPKLRFPEFQNAAGWVEIEIGDKVDLLSGYPFDGPDISQDRNGIPLLRGINVTEGRIRHNPEIDRYYTGSIKGLEKFRLQTNDLLIGMDGSKVGKNSALVSETDAGALLIQRVARLRAENPSLIQFISQRINSPAFHSYVDRINTSSGIPHISAKQIKEFRICFPSQAEQQKIAECLSSVDEVIAAQARKVDALKTHKQGLMQQLFPREGETQPRLRFPKFQGRGEWTTEVLGRLASYENGKAYEKDITEDGKYIVVNSRFISTDGAIRKYTNADYLIAKAGEVLMVLSDLPKGKALAKCYFVDANERYAVNQRVCRLKPNWIDGKFLYYVLNRHPRLLAFDDGLNQTHLSKSGVTECPLCIPPDKKEQQCIADCLSSLDDMITAATHKLEALKRHKRGLMQQLFPTSEETEV